ncbi:hypothetical protein TIFTF001_013455 [Ficus carica]|uniref:Uncharacterized protein n=1 Tax=Ficus carica TaxID=3494 RepID=A0AA88A4F2_FICCA|nr:hypothetical protein TIFTF001_013455 [Ficus carica]
MWVAGVRGGSLASVAGGEKITGDGEDFGWEVLCEIQNPPSTSEDSVLIADVIELSRSGVFNSCIYVPRGENGVAHTFALRS